MPRVKQFKEEEALQKAIKIFWKKGYHATSMQDLVDGMGINRASLYDTFGCKEALFDQAFQAYREANKERIKMFLFSHGSVKEGIFKLFEQTIENAVTDPDGKGCFVVNTTAELGAEDHKLAAVLSENKNDFEGIFYEYLQAGVEKGEIDPKKDLKNLAALIFALYNGIMLLSRINSKKEYLLNIVRTGLTALDR